MKYPAWLLLAEECHNLGPDNLDREVVTKLLRMARSGWGLAMSFGPEHQWRAGSLVANFGDMPVPYANPSRL